MSLIAALTASLSLAVQQVPPADEVAQDPPPVDLPEILVEGRQLESAVRDFVNEVARPANDRGLARWNRPVCVSAINLRGEVARYIVDRVSDVARELGAEAGEPGCQPNVLIVGTTDGAGLADALVRDRPRNYDLRHNGTDAGTRAFINFRAEDRPVRWWATSMPIDSETGGRAVRLPGDIDPSTGRPTAPVINVFAASRLRTQIRDDLVRTTIIVDVDELGGATLVQLADYLAMVALAQINAAADTRGYRTVLNLFDNPATGPDGLTEWDLSYLRALYEHDQLRINRNSQVRSIADAVLRERRAATAPGTD